MILLLPIVAIVVGVCWPTADRLASVAHQVQIDRDVYASILDISET